MNKPYFAKYLPVEGEIKLGDHVYYEEDNSVFHHITEDEPGTSFMNTVGSYYKAKLFLCSRDIQVGDTLRTLTGKETIPVTGIGGGEMETLQIGINNKQLFKVIGEISPDATWVKEGNEFDEEQVKWFVQKNWDKIYGSLNDPWFEGRRKYIAIKGPCGHFH